MREINIKIKIKDFWFALILGVYCSMGAFISLSREATIDNSPDIDMSSEWMLFSRTMYRSFSANRLRTFLFALVVGLFIYVALQVYRTHKERLLLLLYSLLFATAQLVAMIFKKWGGWYAMMETMEEIGVARIQPYRIFMKWSAYVIICYVIVAVMLYFAKYLMEQGAIASVKDSSARHGGWLDKLGCGLGKIFDMEQRAFSWRRFLLMALCMFIAWLPYFIWFYPGTSNEDTVIMMMEYFEIPSYIQKMSPLRGSDIFITNHHPYILTMLFAQFFKLGLYFGDIRIGIAIYSLLHMAFLAFVFSGCLQCLYRWGVSAKRLTVILLLLMFFPLFPMYSICMLKDTIYAAFCLIYIMMMYHIAKSKGAAFTHRGFVAGLFVVSCLMVLTKVYAMYILLIVGVAYLVKYRRYFVQIIVSHMIPPILYKVIFCGMLLPALNVAPGGTQEALSVPFQQTARYVTEYGEEVTEEEKEAISAILPYEKLTKYYNPELSDPVKEHYNQKATKKELMTYFKAWWEMFLKHPEVYVESVLHNTYQYYDINKISSLVYYRFDEFLQEEDEDQKYTELYVEHEEEYIEERYVVNQVVLFMEKVPVLNIFASIGLLPWLYLFALLYNIWWKKKEEQALLFVPFVTIAVCMVSPDNGNTRYIMPLLYLLPFLFALELVPGQDGAIEEKTEPAD